MVLRKQLDYLEKVKFDMYVTPYVKKIYESKDTNIKKKESIEGLEINVSNFFLMIWG